MATRLKATLQSQRELKVKPTPFVLRKLEQLDDLDLTNAEDGSVLVLNAQTEKWTATRTLNNQFIEGGQY